MAATVEPRLYLHYEKTLPQPVQPHLAACCPTMDLIAFVNQDDRLDVYRFNAERAFGLHRRQTDAKVQCVSWKFNGEYFTYEIAILCRLTFIGQYLALGWSDGTIEVVSTATGNAVQQFRQLASDDSFAESTADASSRYVNCIGWGLNLTNAEAAKGGMVGDSSLNAKEHQNTSDDEITKKAFLSLDKLLNGIEDDEYSRVPEELSAILARIDVTSVLPKLPVLPLLPSAAYKSSDHSTAELFASQLSLDAAIHDSNERHNTELDTFLLCRGDGTVQIILYDTLSIGTITNPMQTALQDLKYLQHVSHPFSPTQMLLAEAAATEERKPHRQTILIPLYLKFIQSAGTHLQLIESKTAQLETLMRYIGECLLALHYHWSHAQELPAKFISLASESLQEQEKVGFVQSLYHTVATGNCSSIIREWLLDQLTERGHKRWDHAIMQGYNKVVDTIQQNFLPALDRCDMILTELQGLFEFHEHNPTFYVPQSHFNLIVDIIRCMRLLGHHVLLYAAEERRQFIQFSKWLRHEIDLQATDPTSTTAAETFDRDPGLDYSLLLDYIGGPLQESRLEWFLCGLSDAPLVDASQSRYEDVKKALKAFKCNTEGDDDLLVIASHFNEWQRHNRTLVKKITSWQRASSIMQTGLVLEDGSTRAHDMRMVFEQSIAATEMTTYVALLPEKTHNQLIIHRVVHAPAYEDNDRSIHASESLVVKINDATFKDVKFVDDGFFMALVVHNDIYHIIGNKIFSEDTTDGFMYLPSKLNITQRLLPNGTAGAHESTVTEDFSFFRNSIKHSFHKDDGFEPAKIEVSGKEGRRFFVVLGEDCRQIKIFDIDYHHSDKAWSYPNSSDVEGIDTKSR